MAEFEYAEVEVEGKKLKDWLKSDEGLVKYEACEFGVNVSNTKGIVIFDMGEYEHDPDVGQTHYCNGVDLARVIGALKYGSPYKGMSMMTALEGDSYLRNFLYNFTEISIEDVIIYFFHLVDGDVYISETNYHVFVKGRTCSDEEWKAAVDNLYSRQRKRGR